MLAAFFGIAATAFANFNIATLPANYKIPSSGASVTLYNCSDSSTCSACKWPGSGVSAVLSPSASMSLQVRRVCVDPNDCYVGDQKRKDAICVENLTGTYDPAGLTFDVTSGSGSDGTYSCSGHGTISDKEVNISDLSCKNDKGQPEFDIAGGTSLKRAPGELNASGIKFSGMTGQVEIQLPGEKTWHLAHLDTIIPVDAHIKTGEDSEAILSCSDMSTFILKPESEIVTTGPPAPTSKWQLVAGNLWANVKKMVKDGSMEVEMTQAVAGIKGTTFVLSDDGTHSTLKVIEGAVAYTSKADNKTTLVSTGEMETADTSGSHPKQTFDVASETKSWDAILAAEGVAIGATGAVPAQSTPGSGAGSTSLLQRIISWILSLF